MRGYVYSFLTRGTRQKKIVTALKCGIAVAFIINKMDICEKTVPEFPKTAISCIIFYAISR